MSAAESLSDFRKAGYRRMRATSVLAANSAWIKTVENNSIHKALEQFRKHNYDLERVGVKHVDAFFGYVDEDVADRIAAEFHFIPRIGNVFDHGGVVAYCDMCGKGDSLDHRENLDKIRYTFKLTNREGGNDVWVGSSCILHHQLNVDGARTSEEAEKILMRSLRQHIRMWQIEAWKNEHPDHKDIPALWEKYRRFRVVYPAVYWNAVGVNPSELEIRRRRNLRPFRNAVRFYNRKGFLTEKKMEAWQEAKKVMKAAEWGMHHIRKAMEEGNQQARFDYLNRQRDRLEKRRNRKPRQIGG